MCVIVDANIASLVFRHPPHENFAPVFAWLHDPDKDGRLVYGGGLARELSKLAAARRYLRALDQAGRAARVPDEETASEEQRLLQGGLCTSNDPHVIALARRGGARTLCSLDRDLHSDFTNPRLISRPRGHVYQKPTHAHLLRHTRACLHPWRQRRP